MNPSSDPGSDRPPPAELVRTVRVVLVDKDHVVRAAVRDVLDFDATVRVVGEAGTLAQARDLIAVSHPDVVILDPVLPDGDGLEICRNLHAAKASARCLILTTAIDAGSVLDAIDAGAAAYLVKDLSGLALADSVNAVAAGRSRLERHTTPVLTRELRHRHRENPVRRALLTTVETAILLLLAEDLTNRQIADRLQFTENTVKNYVSRVLPKLHFDNRA